MFKTIGNILIGLLSLVLVVAVGFVAIAIVVWALGLVGIVIAGAIVGLLKAIVIILAVIYGLQLLFGSSRPNYFLS